LAALFFWAQRRYWRGHVLFLHQGGNLWIDRGGRVRNRATFSRLGRAGRVVAADVADGDDLAVAGQWFILPSLPMFLVIPWLIRSGVGFWLAMGVSVAITLALYAGFFWLAPRVGIAL
jgi:hypothetical protein